MFMTIGHVHKADEVEGVCIIMDLRLFQMHCSVSFSDSDTDTVIVIQQVSLIVILIVIQHGD